MRLRHLVLLLVPAALAAEEPYRFEDPFWNLVFAPPGLRKLISPADPFSLFKGRAAGDLYVELRVHEGEKDVAAIRKAIAEKAKGEGVTQGEEPRPWLFYTVTRYKAFVEVHGHAFYARGPHWFEVHAWVTDRTPSAEKSIRAALDALKLGDDPGCGIKARQVAARYGREPLDPEVLLEAGRQYLGEGQPAMAVALLKRARAVAKPDALKKEDQAELLLCGGTAMLEAGAPADAVPWLRDAEKALEGEKAHDAAYQLARAASAAGMLDDAFAALDRAFEVELVVSKARLSKEKELENLRKDPRWEDFWRKRIQDK
jgi:tetratricopeptide (TPR) repeat protein